MGKWKGVRLEIRRQEDSPLQLFDLESDPNETMDVAAANAEIASQIRAIMDSRTPSPIETWNFVRDSTP